MKKIYIFVSIIFIVIVAYTKSTLAIAIINSSEKYLEVGDEFSFSINIKDIKVSAFDLEVKFDSNLLEYVSGPDNTNVINNKIITVWYDEQGGAKAKSNCELVKYTFKAKELGSTNIIIDGNFFNETGSEKEKISQGIQISIEEKTQKISTISEENVENNNSKLKELRLNEEGLLPVFDPTTTEYYFFTENLNSLEVTANAQNSNSEISIEGNKNFKEGINIINITVTSPDKSNTTIYKIHVTKTKNLETANSKLENLAIENAILNPEFNNEVFEYKTEISDEVERLNILAIPERIESTVNIDGGENLQYGNNEVKITVTAENGYSKMTYLVNVYKRTQEEQEKYEQEQDKQRERAKALLVSINEENTENNQSEKEREEKEKKKDKIWSIVILVIILFTIIIAIYAYTKNRKKDFTKK